MQLSSRRSTTAAAAFGSTLALVVGFVGITSLTSSADAATPASGTLTDTSEPVTWSGGPLVPTAVAADLLGSAECVPGACDDFTLTVDVPDSYAADHSVALTIQNTGVSDDYDVYVVDDATGDVVATGAKAGDEHVILPATAATYDVRVLAYMPATDAYTATAALTSGGSGTAPEPEPAPLPTDSTVPGFTNYPAPESLDNPDKDDAGEPSIGNNFNTGATLYQASLSTYKVMFDDSTVPAKDTWTDVSANAGNGCPQGSTISLDPILFTDHETGRTLESQLVANNALFNSLTCITDDDGETWSPSTGGGIPSGADHQSIGGGPFSADDAVGPATDYPHDLYYCSQDIATAFCSASHNGGQTFEAGVPVYTMATGQDPSDPGCGGLHGHIKVGPDGTAYLPNADCGGEQAVVVSRDGGITWDVSPIPGTVYGDSDPSVGTGRDGTVYAGFVNVDRDANGTTTSSIPGAAVSTDQGQTWSPVQQLGTAFGVQNAVFPTVVAGDDDRAAVAYLGTTEGGDYQDAETFHGVWHLYVDMTFDGGRTWTSYDVTPNDPVQRGSICTSGTTCGDDRNLLDFIDSTIDDHGRVLVAFADGCISACATDPERTTHDAYATIARQSTGRTLFAKFDPADTSTPAPTPTASSTPSPTPTSSSTPSPTPTSSGSASPTPTPSETSSPTPTPTPAPTAAPSHNLRLRMVKLVRHGSRLTAKFAIRNTGDGRERHVKLFVLDNGRRVRRTTVSVDPGRRVVERVRFRVDAGRHVVVGKVDPKDRIDESNEADNRARRVIRVR